MSTKKRKNDDQALVRDAVEGVVQFARSLYTVRLPEPITPERLEALRLIDEHALIGVTELAELAKVRPASMSRMVTVLVEEGLVARKKDKEDKRAVSVSLTARGRTLLRRANQVLVRRTAMALGQLSEKEVEVLMRLESKLRALPDDKSR